MQNDPYNFEEKDENIAPKMTASDDNRDEEKNETTYEYVFSYGARTPITPRSDEPVKEEKKTRRGWPRTVAALALCVALSFCVGFFASLMANYMTGESATGSDNPVVYHNDPSSILVKDTPKYSAYGSAGEDPFSVSSVVAMVEDTVVVLDVAYDVTMSVFGQLTGDTLKSSGSGVIISENGYILTCNHVVALENASSYTSVKQTITVTLSNGDRFEASVVGTDEKSDLAILKINATGLHFAEQGSSADLIVGEKVVAIGNPLGTLGGTVTDGIISAKERTVQISDGTAMTLLQTNAAINSGNSGGGLFNLSGKLIGIVNAKYSATGVEGLAFAIPIDSAYPVELDLIAYGFVRGVIDHGLETSDISEAYYTKYGYSLNANGITAPGVYVLSSEFNSELRYKDRIVSVNGQTVASTAELNAVIDACAIGDSVTVVYHRDGKTHTTTLTLREYVPDSMKTDN